MSTFKRTITTALIPLFIAVVSVPVADGAYRLAGARPSDDLEGLWVGFGDGGFRLQPHVKTSADWYSGFFSVWTDGLGLRRGGDEATVTRPGEQVDFLILGDSQGFGQGVDYEATIVGALNRLSSEQAKAPWRFANVGVGGHFLSNQLELARWLQEEQSVSFDNVLLLLTPYLISSAGQYNKATVSDDGKLWGRNPGIIARAALWAKTNTALYGVVRNAFWNVVGAEGDNNLVDFYRVDSDAERIARLRTALGEIETWVEENGGRLHLVYTPLAVELDFSPAQAVAAEAGVAVDEMAPLNATIRVAAELDLPLMDLRPVLEGRAEAGEVISLRGDPHYNKPTSEACARAIWDVLNSGAKGLPSSQGVATYGPTGSREST